MSARLRWAHHGPGQCLWLRFEADAPTRINLEHPALPTESTVAELVPGLTDVTLDPSALATELLAYVPNEPVALRADHDRCDGPVGTPGSAAGLPASLTVVLEDGGGAVVQLSVTPQGDLTLRARRRAAWVEVSRSSIEPGGALRLEGRVFGSRELRDREGARLLLMDRDDQTRWIGPASTRAGVFQATIPLQEVGAAGTGRTWNVSLLLGEDRLRLGRHLVDADNLSRAVVIPSVRVPSTSGDATVRARYTDRSNLVVSVATPTAGPDPRETWWMDHADLLNRSDASEAEAASRPEGPFERLLVSTSRNRLQRRARRDRRRRDRTRAHGRRPRRGDQVVHLLIANRHAVGGTVRATVNTANALAAVGVEVHLTSVYRLEDLEPFAIHPEVRTRVLVDEFELAQRGSDHDRRRLRRRELLRQHPSVLIPTTDPRAYRFSLWSDLQLVRFLRRLKAGTLITTRAGLSVVAATFAPRSVRVIAQQHVPFSTESPELQRLLGDAYRRCDAVCVLTQADHELLSAQLQGSTTQIRRLANPLDAEAAWEPDGGRQTRIVCGGRLSPVKGTDLLVRAFARAAPSIEGWELRIVGPARADRLAAVKRFIEASELSERVLLPPPTPRMDLELAAAGLCVVPSRHEAFGMIIIEAMHAGVPVIAFDCPSGPGEIITHGVDGLLVPAEDVEELAATIQRCVQDPELRDRLAAAGRRTAERYAPAAVAADLRTIIADLEAGHPTHSSGGRP